jgi:hypothetical protein
MQAVSAKIRKEGKKRKKTPESNYSNALPSNILHEY